MERFILKKLLDWKNSPYRKPLILKGVRQVLSLIHIYSYDTSIIKNSEMQSKPASYNSRHIITTHAEIRVLDERCDKMKKMVGSDAAKRVEVVHH